jgi:flagellar biosynthesis protein FlhF
MQIKRFQANDMTKALSRIKQEFGPDAVILSARTLKKPRGILSYMRKPIVEVTAATDTYTPKDKKRASLTNSETVYEYDARLPGYKGVSKKMPPPDPHYDTSYGLKNNLKPLLKRRFGQEFYSGELHGIQKLMLKQGVGTDLAAKWLEELKRTHEFKRPLNGEELKRGIVQALSGMGPAASQIENKPKKREIVVFVGPTGVGKTTTIAKIAAIQAIKMRKTVALITLDNCRIAAIEHLKAYARVIGIPMEVASSIKDLRTSVKKLRNRHLILIDTPGMSQKNENQINELRDMLEGISPIQTHLLMSATTNDSNLMDIWEKFKVIPIARLLFTKLDETTTFGNIVNQLCRSKIPVSYFTNGQEIPEDIEVANLEKLVNLMLGEAVEEIWDDEDNRNEHIMEFFVANKTSDVFHHPDCNAARKIKATGMVVFEGIADALNKGFKPCRLCNPGISEARKMHSGIKDERKIYANRQYLF